MHLDERDPDCRQRIPQSDAGMGKRRGIEYDEIHAGLTGILDLFDQFGLGVALEAIDLDTRTVSLGSQSLADLRQRFSPVDLRLPDAEKIQIGTMQDQDLPGASRRGRPRFATLRRGFHGGQFAAVSWILSRFKRN